MAFGAIGDFSILAQNMIYDLANRSGLCYNDFIKSVAVKEFENLLGERDPTPRRRHSQKRFRHGG